MTRSSSEANDAEKDTTEKIATETVSKDGDTVPIVATKVIDTSINPHLIAYPEWLERKQQVEDRLKIISIPPLTKPKATNPSSKKRSRKAKAIPVVAKEDDTHRQKHPPIPYSPKIDVHWDFLMKELMWLGTDFASERKRQIAAAKRLGASVLKFHQNKEARRIKQLQLAETKRRKLAAKLGREVKGWWTKLEKIVAYKQKLEADKEKQQSMNKQLVKLVQQTEKYTESLSTRKSVAHVVSAEEDDSSHESASLSSKGSFHRRKKDRSRTKQESSMTIEEALAMASKQRRKTKSRMVDYSHMNRKLEETEFYGESTADENSLGESEVDDHDEYDPLEDSQLEEDSDDEATLRLAMEEELQSRHDAETLPINLQQYSADPEELRKLKEEQDMNIEAVLKRLQHEAQDEERQEPVDTDNKETKKVKFEDDALPRMRMKRPREDPGEDADDDGDASDVEDYLEQLKTTDHTETDDDDNYHACEPEPDDETTLIAEEQLGRDMTYEEEIALLNRESEMSVEELRAMYAGMVDANPEKEEEQGSSVATTEDESEGETTVHENDDDEFEADQNEVDDETTMIEEERLGRDMTYEEEIAMLNRENEMSVEELRAMYAGMSNNSKNVEENLGESDVTDGETSSATGDDDDEFEADHNEVDDETTIIVEEKLGRDMTYEEEIAMLNRENEMTVDELRAMYAGMNSAYANEEANPQTNIEKIEESNENDDTNEDVVSGSDDDGEFEVSGDPEVDDETTMIAEEKLGRDMTYEEELEMLNRENEMSVEELRAMYAGIDNKENEDDIASIEESNDAMDVDSVSSETNKTNANTDEIDDHNKGTVKRSRSDTGVSEDVKRLRTTDTDDVIETSETDGAAAMKALEASAAKARETLASRPFLLASWVKLRKYQQIGLNWLVSLQSRRLNGILADGKLRRKEEPDIKLIVFSDIQIALLQNCEEMGLGKTLQTISLLAYLASYKGIWGPHLVVVPTSVIINWETELKRFCPGLKVLCYYGNAKRRKELRTGWTKANWYHVVVTSYQLAVQDAFAFKRKKWYYLILDEAQNIKNFQSQRWQTLINFNTQRRLLLTGTPLQNNLMELWSLLHFLMPYIFKSRKEFAYWFSNPMNNIIEGTGNNHNADVIKRLHGIIRPFVLRRLKKEVETQMPGKFEHIVKCQLSRRQMTLYEEFLSRSSTRQALKKGGNFMGMMNVLMQLRKVCNHPDLFEPRSVVTPFVLPSLVITAPRCVCEIRKQDDFVERISSSTENPLWSGSSGQPSIDAALRHDPIESGELRLLCAGCEARETLEIEDDGRCPTELENLVQEVYKARQERQASRTVFHNAINERRCKAPTFPYPSHLLNLVGFECDVFNRAEPSEVHKNRIIETPAKLLELRRTEKDRAFELEQTIEKFVFRVPPAGGRAPVFDNGIPKSKSEFPKDVERQLIEPLEDLLEPYRKARARLSSFFPDKKLVQYDAGKLQALSVLLRRLKEGGHRCLIFTQMGKVLDVLEAFLCMNGHTYLRLDGSTGVDKRQRLMDRFNNDTRLFCFILSTRSGGTGINLTGADTVIFYDSDWNPAMDAQAQDRAHRIGQTRDVHIYRLITEHTIEENILKKAQKKRNLDIMVMDQGKFNASTQKVREDDAHAQTTEDVKDVYTKKGLQAILGFVDDEPDQNIQDGQNAEDMSKAEMERAMASLEDEDDALALRGAQREAEEEQKEFDENTAIPKTDSDDDEVESDKARGKRPVKKSKGSIAVTSKPGEKDQNSDEKDLEKEFAAWQSAEGFDAKAIHNALSPMERYGLNFREEIDPFYSIFFINEQRRKMEVMEGEEEIDMDEVERQKALEEQQAIDNQDLLATGILPEDLVRQRDLYKREKVRLLSEKMRRKITGELWSQKVDGQTKHLFWYNEETGEATWDTPGVVAEIQAEELAVQEGWRLLPLRPLFHIMEYLVPFPERQQCSAVCRQWNVAATDIRFVRHVYPVEMGALASRHPSKRHPNHFATIEDAMSGALPGDTIELGDGHYWVNNPGIIVDKPLRFVGDESNPSNVVVEMSGSVQWNARGGWIEGITFRRPKISSAKTLPSVAMLTVHGSGKVDTIHSVFDNDGSTGPVSMLSGSGNKGKWTAVTFRNGGSCGIYIDGGENVEGTFIDCTIKGSKSDGLFVTNKGKFRLSKCVVESNNGYGVRLATSGCHAELFGSRFNENLEGVIKKETHCVVTSSMNTAILTAKPKKQIPGFKLVTSSSYSSSF